MFKLDKGISCKSIAMWICLSVFSGIMATLFTACGGSGFAQPDGVTYTLGGTVIGLNAGNQVALSNTSDPLMITSNGSFSFGSPMPRNSNYVVTVVTQPVGQVCTVSNGTGSGMVANVSNVVVTCSTDMYTIDGQVNGLAKGTHLTIYNNSADPMTVSANGFFPPFGTPVAYGGSYSVTVGTQPTGQTCTPSKNFGAGVTSNITTVMITCSVADFTLGGQVNGLNPGQQVTLNNSNGDELTATVNGVFQFGKKIAYDGGYQVTIGTQPIGQVCTVTNGAGSGMVANVTNILVNCTTDMYTIDGQVSNLAAGTQVTLYNNGADPQTVTANGYFPPFGVPVAYDGSYSVTVAAPTPGQTCTPSNNVGHGVTADITTVLITCSPIHYSIAGRVTGLNPGEQVTLNNSNGDAYTVTGTGAGSIPFQFSELVAYDGSYNVTIGTPPIGQTCTPSQNSGNDVTANVTNVLITCSTIKYTIAGQVSGLTSGQVTLDNSNGDTTTVLSAGTANANFQFTEQVAYGGSYNVTVGTQPVGLTCTQTSNYSGSNLTANVTTVLITCTSQFTVSGQVTGLNSANQLTLINNTLDTFVVPGSGNGAFQFSQTIPYGGSYDVTVGLPQPNGQVCTPSNNTGSNVKANVTGVLVNCVTPEYSIQVTILGVSGANTISIENNGVITNSNVQTAGNPFVVTTQATYGTTYDIEPSGVPSGLLCVPSSNTGTVANSNITNVLITCSPTGGS